MDFFFLMDCACVLMDSSSLVSGFSSSLVLDFSFLAMDSSLLVLDFFLAMDSYPVVTFSWADQLASVMAFFQVSFFL